MTVVETRLSILVPYRPNGGVRSRIGECALARLGVFRQHGSDAEVIYANDGGWDADLFNHGKAINNAFEQSHGDVLLIADADTTYDHAAGLIDAVYATSYDRHWRLPHRYIQLTEAATERRLRVWDWEIEPEEMLWVGDSVSWSGLIIVPREAFEKVGGADERYLGWGADDIAFGAALDTLYGIHVRYSGSAVHLWHPRGEQEHGLHRHGDEGRDLTRRYEAAFGDRAAMRKLIEGKRL